MTHTSSIKTEFYRPIHLGICSRVAKDIKTKATAQECKMLAERLQVINIKNLHLIYRVTIDALGKYVIKGRVKSRIEQKCVVTSHLINQNIQTDFKEIYSINDKLSLTHQQSIASNNNRSHEEEFNSLTSDYLDIGELAIQFLALDIELYPRTNEDDCQKILYDFNLHNDISEKTVTHNESYLESPFHILKKILQ